MSELMLTKLQCAYYLSKSWKINFPGWVGVVRLAENIGIQPSSAGAWAKFGNFNVHD